MTIDEGINKLAGLAQKQGHITYDDINDAFQDTEFSAEELDEVYVKLRTREIEIIDQVPDHSRD